MGLSSSPSVHFCSRSTLLISLCHFYPMHWQFLFFSANLWYAGHCSVSLSLLWMRMQFVFCYNHTIFSLKQLYWNLGMGPRLQRQHWSINYKVLAFQLIQHDYSRRSCFLSQMEVYGLFIVQAVFLFPHITVSQQKLATLHSVQRIPARQSSNWFCMVRKTENRWRLSKQSYLSMVLDGNLML